MCRWFPFDTKHFHAVVSGLLQLNGFKIGNHIGTDIIFGVAHFVEQLFFYRIYGDTSAGMRVFGDVKMSIGKYFGNRVSEVAPFFNFLPVGKITAGALCSAFNNVSGNQSRSQFVPIVQFPAKFKNSRSHCY